MMLLDLKWKNKFWKNRKKKMKQTKRTNEWMTEWMNEWHRMESLGMVSKTKEKL